MHNLGCDHSTSRLWMNGGLGMLMDSLLGKDLYMRGVDFDIIGLFLYYDSSR